MSRSPLSIWSIQSAETMASHGLQLVRTQRSQDKLRRLFDAVVDGTLRFPVESLPFTEIVAAHQRLDSRHATGKLVLDLSDNPLLPHAQEA